MEKKQTAVEWLVEQFDLEMFDTFHLNKINYAKALEKQQIVDATKPHPITIEHLMDLLLLYYSRKITEPRLIEIINEIAAGQHKNGIEI